MMDLNTDYAETESSMARLARDHYIGGRLPEDVFFALHDELSVKLETLRRERAAREDLLALRKTDIQPGSREDIEEWWAQAPLSEQRAALQQAIFAVTIQPAKVRGGNKFDTGRVELKWRWELYIRASDAEWEHMTDAEREQAAMESHAEAVQLVELESAGATG